MLNFFEGIKRLIAICLVMLLIVTSTLTILPASAKADNISIVKNNLPSIEQMKEMAKNNLPSIEQMKGFKEIAKKLVPPNPVETLKDILIGGLEDGVEGRDRSNQKATKAGLVTTVLVATSVTSAASAGAGTLAGYAGIASAVSSMGLGGVTTAIAGAMGTNVFGAAATAVVTSAVGGPAVMGVILIGGTAATAYGTYEAAHWIGKQFQLWK